MVYRPSLDRLRCPEAPRGGLLDAASGSIRATAEDNVCPSTETIVDGVSVIALQG